MRLIPELKSLLEDPEADGDDLEKFVALVCIYFIVSFTIYSPSKLQKGANDARSDDIRRVKEELGGWLNLDFSPVVPFTTKSRSDRGLQNDTTGRLLCPIEHNWDDERQVANSNYLFYLTLSSEFVQT